MDRLKFPKQTAVLKSSREHRVSAERGGVPCARSVNDAASDYEGAQAHDTFPLLLGTHPEDSNRCGRSSRLQRESDSRGSAASAQDLRAGR